MVKSSKRYAFVDKTHWMQVLREPHWLTLCIAPSLTSEDSLSFP